MAGATQPKTPTNVFTAGSQKAFNAQLKKVYTVILLISGVDTIKVFDIIYALQDLETIGKE